MLPATMLSSTRQLSIFCTAWRGGNKCYQEQQQLLDTIKKKNQLKEHHYFLINSSKMWKCDSWVKLLMYLVTVFVSTVDIFTLPGAELTSRSFDGTGLLLSLLIYDRHSTVFLCKSAWSLPVKSAEMFSGVKQLPLTWASGNMMNAV